MCELSELPSIEHAPVEQASTPRERVLGALRSVTVEPLLFAGQLFILLYSIVLDQYIYHRVAIDNPPASNASLPAACNASADAGDSVSALSSEWILYCNAAGFATSFLATLSVCAWGDQVGRKPPLILVHIGFLALTVVHLAVMGAGLDLWWLLVGRALCGLGGDYSALLACAFAYLSDVVPHRSRTLRLAVAEASLGIGGIVGEVASGPWIDSLGFQSPMWFLLCLNLSSLAYIVFVLDESAVEDVKSSSQQQQHISSWSWKLGKLINCQPYRSVWEYLRRGANHVMYTLAMLACLFLQSVTYDGMLDVLVVYEKSAPLCWSSALIGYAQAIFVSTSIFGLIAMKACDGRVSELKLLSVGVLSEMTCLVFYASTTLTYLIFVGLVLGLLTSIPVVVLRSTISKLTTVQDQGSVFALGALVQSVAGLVGSFIFNGVYTATVDGGGGGFERSVFVIGACFYLTVMIIFCLMKKTTRIDLLMKDNDYGSLEESEA